MNQGACVSDRTEDMHAHTHTHTHTHTDGTGGFSKEFFFLDS